MGIQLGDGEVDDFKIGTLQVDRVYLGKAFVWPQHPIDDFAASDNRVRELQFTWTDSNYPLPHSYDLFEGDNRIYDDIQNGQVLEAAVGVNEYRIEAMYEGGHNIDSNYNSGESLDGIAPGYIDDFNATDDEFQQVTCTWSNDTIGDPVPTYDVYVNGGILDSNVTSPYTRDIPSGTDDYYVRAVNFKGGTDSNHNSGTAIAGYPPGEITNFQASDDQELNVQMWWTHPSGYPTPLCDLYQDGGLLYANVVSGVSHGRAAGTSLYKVIAHNDFGTKTSNEDYGTALEIYVPPPDPDPGRVEYTIPGDHLFEVPAGVTSINLCQIGAGGGGGTGSSIAPYLSIGGGFAGAVYTETMAVSPGQQLAVHIGTGGAGGWSDGFNATAGSPGSGTSFAGRVSAGGSGGVGNNYPGNGGARGTCYGTAYDGTAVYWSSGGQAGFNNGGNGAIQSYGGLGSRGSGGGAASTDGVPVYAGQGGHGCVVVTWG